MNQCAIYIRVSHKFRQADMYGLDAQKRACLDYADKQGWSVYRVYEDTISAKSDERPAFQRMIADAASVGFDLVLVHKLDRFARNRIDSALYKERLRNLGVDVVSATEHFDRDAPSGFLMEGFLELIAEFYRYNLRQETIKGMREKTIQGGWPRSAPIGYKNVREGRRAWIEVDAVMGARIALAFERFSTGDYTLDSWATAAYADGVRTKTGSKIYPSQWSRIFHNGFYAGWVTWDDEIYQGNHKPLVSQGTFDRVQAILARRDVDSDGFTWKYFYLLKGLVWSDDTNSRCRGATAKKKFRYYVSKQRLPSGKKHYIPAGELEQQVFKYLMLVSLVENPPTSDERLAMALRVGL